MKNIFIEKWCEERAQLIAGLLQTLELKESQIPANADTGDYHVRSILAKDEAFAYLYQLKANQIEVYNSYPHDPSDLKVGLLLIPSRPGYHSLPWKCKPTSDLAFCRDNNSIPLATWMFFSDRQS